MRLVDHPKWPTSWASSATSSGPPPKAVLTKVKEILGQSHKPESIQIVFEHSGNRWSVSFSGSDDDRTNLRALLDQQKGKALDAIKNIDINPDFTPIS